MSKFESSLDPEQAVAVSALKGPLCVLAGAGSGKTRVLVHRVCRLVETGVPPDRILAVTFSKKAAGEMQQRAEKLGVVESRFGTWHSLALQILREEELVDGWTIDDSNRAQTMLKEAVGYKGLDWAVDIGKLASFIGLCKARMFEVDSTGAKELALQMFSRDGGLAMEARRMLDAACDKARLLTFDEMLCAVVRYLSAHEDARRTWAGRWDYVLQDEAQDCNPVQATLAELLTRDHRNYMVVGDPSQSLYGWRGSDPAFIMRFEAAWAAEVVCLCRNYRSGAKIVELANTIIRPAVNRLPEDLKVEATWEGSVLWQSAKDLDVEAEFVADNIEASVTAPENARRWADHTILYRTNAQSRALEEALLARKIPHVVVGGVGFYERREVKALLCYLAVAAKHGDVLEAIKRCINAPFRFLGNAFVAKLCEDFNGNLAATLDAVVKRTGIQSRQRASAGEWLDLLQTLEGRIAQKANPAALLEFVVDKTHYLVWLSRDQGEESLDASHHANVKELIRVASKFGTATELLEFVASTKAKAAVEAKEAAKNGAGNRVLLMSIHRSKGLEWPCVHVAGCCEGILPHGRGDPDEERRLFYVACTRASHELHLTSPVNIPMRKGIVAVARSRYLDEAGVK